MRRLTVADKDRIAASAAPEAVTAMLTEARTGKRQIDGQIAWLEDLLARRCREVAARTWPPGGPCPNEPPCPHPASAHDPGAGPPGDPPWCLDCDCGDEGKD